MSFNNVDIIRRNIGERTILLLIICALILFSCSRDSSSMNTGSLIIDSFGRKVVVPDTINSVIALKSGSLRLLTYMGLSDIVSHIEGGEQRRQVPYMFANESLRSLPVIGVGSNYDTELLAAAKSDLIIATFMSSAEADRLQKITKKPVVLLDYGDLSEGRERLFATLNLMGEVFAKEERAESLIAYISDIYKDLDKRAKQAAYENSSVYIGGLAFNGAHGITSTETDYPPFEMLSLNHPAGELSIRKDLNSLSHETLFINTEQLIDWNPSYIFLDASGRQIWQEEILWDVIKVSLEAFQKGNVYSLLPYTWNTMNYECILCNAWFIGSVMMPYSFNDIDIMEKSREIFYFFYAKDIWDKTYLYYSPFQKIDSIRE